MDVKQFGAGYVKRVHVDQAVIRRNRKTGVNDPAITIQTSVGSFKVQEVEFGPGARLVQREKPLSCGARIFIETRGWIKAGEYIEEIV